MRYVQLRAFHFVATRGGFSRAAEALNLTQPAISDQVRKLETEFDVLLFDRSRKRVVLTPIGDRLLEVTRRMFETDPDLLSIRAEERFVKATGKAFPESAAQKDGGSSRRGS